MTSLGLFVLGTAVAGYGTLIGAGGGFLLVPILLFAFPTTEPAVITSLSLASVVINALSGSIAYARLSRIDYRVAAVLATVAVPGTMAGASFTRQVPRPVFEVAFGTAMLSLAVFLLWKPSPWYRRRNATPIPPVPAAGNLYVATILSVLVGIGSGLLGIGGSPLQVVVLTHAMDLPVHTAMPTSQFMVLLAAAGGVFAHLASGDFHIGWRPLIFLGSGAAIGAPLGAMLAARISGTALVRLMAATLVVLGASLVIGPLLSSDHAEFLPSHKPPHGAHDRICGW